MCQSDGKTLDIGIVQPGGFKVMYNQKGIVKFSLKVVKYALF